MHTPNTAPDLFHTTKLAWLDECRAVARKLLKTRNSITVEDVLKECPRPKYLKPNNTGTIFQHEDFVAVGYTTARKASSHRRVIRVWSLR